MTARPLHLADILELLADAVSDRLALITEDAEISYGALDGRATRLANHLASEGIRAGDRVAVYATNRTEWVEAWYGCFKLRAAAVNVNYRYREHELRYLLGNADCAAVLVAPEFLPALDSVGDVLEGLRERLVFGEEYEAAITSASDDRSFEGRSPDDLYLVYTGGTTGMPKGVVWRHEDIILGAMNSMRGNRPIDGLEQLVEEALSVERPMRLMGIGPLMHGGSQWIMGNAHVAGGTFVLYTAAQFDARRVLELASRSRSNMVGTIGDAMARPIAEALLDPGRPRWDLSALQSIGNGGAPLSASVRERLQAALPDALIVDSYGSSETGSATSQPAGDASSANVFQAGPHLAVFDGDFHPCPVGEIGVLARSGRIPVGYFNDPEKTADTFRVVDGRRWAISGDFARVEHGGKIVLIGRGSGVIVSGGEKIYPEEVESALLKQPAVLDAVVVGTPSERWGQQVTALVQLRDDLEATDEDLRMQCRGLLADYKVPKEVLFVEAVPRTAVGKIDRPEAGVVARRLLGTDV